MLPFKVANGINQGGILSPYQYYAKADILNIPLCDTNVSTHIHCKCINSELCRYGTAGTNTGDNAEPHWCMCVRCQAQHCLMVPPAHAKVYYQTSAWLSRNALTFMGRFTYLGHVINQAMFDDDDIKKTTKLLVIGNMLLRRFSFCSKEVKLESFRNHCYCLLQLTVVVVPGGHHELP